MHIKLDLSWPTLFFYQLMIPFLFATSQTAVFQYIYK